jgi:hypothetical protein
MFGSSGYNVRFSLNLCMFDFMQLRQKKEKETGKVGV